MAAFANFGFPESHSVSFAYLVYASAWIKLHEPAAFCAALLNAQPMGFYSPQSLVQDARRHGVVVHTPDLNASDWRGRRSSRAERSEGGVAVRLGLSSVRVARRRPGQGDRRRTSVRRPGGPRAPRARAALAHLEALATAGVFGCFGLDRREALWAVGAVAQSRPGRLAGIVTGADAPTLPGMSDQEEAIADLWATGVAPDGHPTRFVRERLDGPAWCRRRAAGPRRRQPGAGGRRGHPPPAAGHRPGHHLPQPRGRDRPHQRGVLEGLLGPLPPGGRGAPALLIRGRLEKAEGVVNVVAEHIEPLPVAGDVRSRDFR